MSQRIELFSWLKELNFFQNDSKILLKTTQRIKPFFEDDPKNRTSFYRKYVLRIVFQYDSHNWTYFSALLKEWNIWVWLKELNFLWYDSHNWTLKNSKNWFSQLQELNFFWKTWLKEFFTLFSHITQRIELFSRRWLKELNPSYKTQRLENFFTWLKDFNLLNMTQWIEPLLYMTQRIEPFLGNWLNGLNPLHERTQRIGHQKIIWLQQPNLFVYDLGNWAFFFFLLTQRIELFLKNITQKLLTWLTELNSVLEHDSPNWTFFLKNMTHRNWTLLFNMSQRKWLHF